MTNISRFSQGLKKAQSRLLNQNTKKILNNVFLLYVVLFASITDLLFMVANGAHINVILFIVVAYITYLFSKNMLVILIVALAITNIYHLGSSIILKEGFEEGNEDDAKKIEDDAKKIEDDAKKTTEDSDKMEEDSNTDEEKKTKIDKLPEEYKNTLKQLSDPETLKTIEGLKSLEPLVGRMEKVIGMFK